jgi:glycosyltransferase involved in cell wall biosynthesis
MSMAAVSLCMIVRNEEANLPSCLETAGDLVDEIIVVDTGSTDATRQIATGQGARVVDFAWIDDFAAARNESLRHARHQWIFWLDADDRLDEVNRARLRKLFTELPRTMAGYVMTYLALNESGSGRQSAADHLQLFPNHPDIRWHYRVHEQILPALERAGGQIHATDIVIHHLGYQDPAIVRRKLERNCRLLRLDHADFPDDALVLFNLGRTLLRLDQTEEAVTILERSIARFAYGPPSNVFRTACALLVEGLGKLRRPADALLICTQARATFPDDPELLLAEGIFRLNLGDLAAARACLTEVLLRDPDNAQARFHLGRLGSMGGFSVTVGS